MSVTRRRLIAIAGAASAFVLTDRGVRAASAAVGRAIGSMRPATDGTSATRCALCGAVDHAMLDPRCPRALRVR